MLGVGGLRFRCEEKVWVVARSQRMIARIA